MRRKISAKKECSLKTSHRKCERRDVTLTVSLHSLFFLHDTLLHLQTHGCSVRRAVRETILERNGQLLQDTTCYEYLFLLRAFCSGGWLVVFRVSGFLFTVFKLCGCEMLLVYYVLFRLFSK